LRDVAGRRLFTDTTEHWKRRASLRGPSVHHSEAERFIRKATELLGHRASALPHIRYINPFRHANSAQYRKWVNWPSRRNRGRRRRAPSPLPPHGRIVVLDGHQFGVEVIGLSADQRS
jgi:hypothetical protein